MIKYYDQAVGVLWQAFFNSEIKGFWLKQIEVRQEQAVKYSTYTYKIAKHYALLNKKNEALKIIEDNSLYGDTCWNGLNVEPAFDSLRSKPHYHEILRKMNL